MEHNYSNISSSKSIKNYVNGLMTKEEQYAFEQEMNKDPFLAEAVDGYQAFPQATLPTNPYQKGFPIQWIYLSLLVLAIGISTIWYVNNNDQKYIAREHASIGSLTINSAKKQYIPIKEQGPVVEVKASSIITQKEKPIIPEPKSTREYIEMFTLRPSSLLLKPISSKSGVVNKKYKTVSYYNYIAVDYSEEYQLKKDAFNALTGTISSFAHDQFELEDMQRLELLEVIETEKLINYKLFLELTFKAISQKDNNEANRYLTILLQNFPNDVNGQFYKGYLAYNKENYKKAITFFDQVITNANQYFKEDALWLKANALESNLDLKKAYALYAQIAKSNSFYKIQAKNKF